MVLFDQGGAGTERSQIIQPNSTLQEFVEHFWIQTETASQVNFAPWRIVPDANPYIIAFIPNKSGAFKNIHCTIVGARSRFVDISIANRALTFGVRLRLGALPLLTQLPALEFTDRGTPVQAIFGARGRLLMDQLSQQSSGIQGLQVLAKFLQAEFKKRKFLHNIGALTACNGRVEDLAVLLGLPIRTLHARVKEQVGLAPKRLLRILRLHKTLSIALNQSFSWAQASAISGFADQAHLVREFQDLLGESPTSWKRRSLAYRFIQDKAAAKQ